ncbi:hypothetical protein MM300_20380 [Evansella sp. LMS18]|uniref:hypothetical protein n=1 Tax=Evansella sp. LMS18 TaxID=2924033 RepID=UPI0020D151F2|nr:hypothetical protein [Evansella sp. LMS18]UTR10207.1 hypothetical protein MM300_20380 [Evansella sp. LMS18]
MPIQLIIKRTVEYVKANPEKAAKIATAVGTGLTFIATNLGSTFEKNRLRKKEKLEEGGFPYRKERLIRYSSEIQKQFPDMQKKKLFFHLLEVEDIIQAVNNDIKNTIKVNPALILKKELKAWKDIQDGIVRTMENLDYEELLLVYNDSTYKSDYLEGFNLYIETINKLMEEGDKKKIHLYIKEITNKPMSKIERDFL